MSQHRVFLSLGTNLGVRTAQLRTAVRLMAPQVRVTRLSPIYETAPWGYADQPDFLNQTLEAETDLEPAALLAHLKGVEARMGRQTVVRNGPRTIDIDILFYDDAQVDLPDVQIPHPRLPGRAFILTPLVHIAPDLVHPGLGQTVAEMASDAGNEGVRPYKKLAWGRRTYVMGILNITPDSFSGDGLLAKSDPMDAVLRQAHAFVEAGADILDIGGESTRPGSQPVSLEDELARVIPVVQALAEKSNAILSVDTFKAEVAEQALDAGADWINDVWGLRADPRMADVAACAGVPVVLMHNRSRPANAAVQERLGGRYIGIPYMDLLGEVKAELLESVGLARAAGVAPENIILDPGIGFGKSVEQNLELVRRLDEIKALGYPLLLGVSRKSFIGYTLNLTPDQRMEGSLAAGVIGITRGADILRVHDVQATVRAAHIADAVLRGTGEAG